MSSSSDQAQPRKRAKQDGDAGDGDTAVVATTNYAKPPPFPSAAAIAENWDEWYAFGMHLSAAVDYACLAYHLVVLPRKECEAAPALASESPDERLRRARDPAQWTQYCIEPREVVALLPHYFCPPQSVQCPHKHTHHHSVMRLRGTSLCACVPFHMELCHRYTRHEDRDTDQMEWIRLAEPAVLTHIGWPPRRRHV